MKKYKRRIVTMFLALIMSVVGVLGAETTSRADICGGLTEEDVFTPDPKDVIQDPVLHWAVRAGLNAVKSREVLTKETLQDKTLEYISFEQNRHPEDFNEWTKQYWIEDLEGIQYATSAKMINICYTSNVNKELKNIKPLGELTQLDTLLLAANDISDIDCLKTLVNLSTLDISANKKIDKIDAVEKMTKLTNLNVSGNAISDVSVLAGLKNLKTVNISYNQVDVLPDLAKLEKVTSFSAAGNKLDNEAVKEIGKLKHLQSLDLSGNEKITDLKPLAGLVWLEKESVILPQGADKDNLFAAIAVNKLFNEFNISRMQKSDIANVEETLKAYDALTEEQKSYMDAKKAEAARANLELVKAGKEPTVYPDYDEGGDKIPVWDRLEIKVVDKHGKAMPGVDFTKQGKTAYAEGEKTTVTTDDKGILTLIHTGLDVNWDEIIVMPDESEYVADPKKITYNVINKTTDEINGKKATGLEELSFVLIPAEEYVDKTELKEALKKADAVEEAYKYEDSLYAEYEKALKKAKEVKDDVDAAAKDVKDAAQALEKAISALEKKEILTTLKLNIKDENGNPFTREFKFQALVSLDNADGAWNCYSEAESGTAYIPVSPAWSKGTVWNFLACIDEPYEMDPVKVVVGVKDNKRYYETVNGEPVDADFEMDVTVRALAQAPNPDVNAHRKPDASVMKTAIEKAEKYQKSDYTPKTWSALQNALQTAREILEQSSVTQNDYNRGTAEIRKAEAGLEKTANKVALREEINMEYSLKEIEYTKDSWAVYAAELKKAKELESNANATQTEVDEQTEKLRKAREDLKPSEGGDVILSDDQTFRARVVDEKGKPVNGVSFSVTTDDDGDRPGIVSADGKIEYRLTALDYALEFTVALSDNNEGWLCEDTHTFFTKATPVEIKTIDGKPLANAGEIVYVLKKEGGEPGQEILSDAQTFRAKVVDEDGNPVNGVSFDVSTDFDGDRPGIVSADGKIEYKLVASIDYDLGFTVTLSDNDEGWICEDTHTFSTGASPVEITDIDGKSLADAGEIVYVLKKEGGDNPDVGPDKTELRNKIAEYSLIEKGNYTDVSYEALQSAIANAKEVEKNEKATKDEVEKAVQALDAAKEALKSEDPGPTPGDSVLSDKQTFRAKVVDEDGNPVNGVSFDVSTDIDGTRPGIVSADGKIEYKLVTFIDYDLGFTVTLSDNDEGWVCEDTHTFSTGANPVEITDIDGKDLADAGEIVYVLKKEGGDNPDEGPDKTELRNKIAEYSLIEKGNYTDTSYEALQTAIENAKEVEKDEKATKDEVEKAVQALDAAKEALKSEDPGPLPGDGVLSDAQTFRAKVVDEDGNPVNGVSFDVSTDFDGTRPGIVSADGKIEYKLEALIDYDLGFTVTLSDNDEGWVCEDTHTFSTGASPVEITDIDGKDLADAGEIVYVLKKEGGDNPDVGPDKTELRNKIAEYSLIEKGNYTDASYEALQTAIENAKEVEKNEKATKDEVEKAVQELDAAKKALKEKAPDPKPEPGDGKDDNNGGGSTGGAGSTSGDTNVKAVKTGDTANPTAMAGYMVIAALAVCVILRRRASENK